MTESTYSLMRSPATRTLAVAATIIAVPGGAFFILDELYGRAVFSTIIPAYHGPLLLGLAVLAAVVLWFALSGLRSAEASLQAARVAVLRAKLQLEISDRLLAEDRANEDDVMPALPHNRDDLGASRAAVRSPRSSYRGRDRDGE